MSEANVSVNINFRSINLDRLEEIVVWARKLSPKFSVYVDDEIVLEEVVEDDPNKVDEIWKMSEIPSKGSWPPGKCKDIPNHP